jgi:hypothetical protein
VDKQDERIFTVLDGRHTGFVDEVLVAFAFLRRSWYVFAACGVVIISSGHGRQSLDFRRTTPSCLFCRRWNSVLQVQ